MHDISDDDDDDVNDDVADNLGQLIHLLHLIITGKINSSADNIVTDIKRR